MIKKDIISAYTFAEEAHKGQIRKFSNLPYFSHPKGVARIIEDLCNDEILIVVSLLHDVIEDTHIIKEDLVREFGEHVTTLVLELTSDSVKQREQGKKVYLLNKMINMSNDALLIKLADRLHNILYLQDDIVPLKFITKYYKETRFLMRNLKEDRDPLGDKHNILIGKIESILDFLQIRHEF